MLLESVFGSHDERREGRSLDELRRDFKGFELAHRILQRPNFHQLCKQLFEALHVAWDWYTNEVLTIRTPLEGFQSKIAISALDWHVGEITDHFVHTFSKDTFQQVGLGAGSGDSIEVQDSLVANYVNLCLDVGSNLCWSKLLAVIPPCCYVGVASSSTGFSEATVEKMKSDWAMIEKVEQLATWDPRAEKLLSSMPWLRKKAVRLLFMLFERDGWKVGSIAGQNYIRALQMLLPDNKLVEDVHAYLRDLSREARSNVSSPLARTAAAIHSQRLESRGIKHNKVTQEEFRANFGTNRKRKFGQMFNPRLYQLPQVVFQSYYVTLNFTGLRRGVRVAWISN